MYNRPILAKTLTSDIRPDTRAKMPRDKLPLNHSYRSSSPRRSILSVLPKRRSARALILLVVVSIIGFFVVRCDPERFSPVMYQLYEHKWLSSFTPRLGSFYSAPKPASHPPQVHTSEPEQGPEGATLRELVSESIALEKERFLKEIQYDKDYETRHMHAPVTSTLDPSLEAYVNRLRWFVRDYLRESPHRPHLDLMLDRLGQHIAPPLYKDEPIPKVVLSTHKDLKGLPDFFQNWEKRLKPEGWEVKVADDDVMQTWFDAWSEGSEGLKRIWDTFPKPVLKTDFLRYVAMLLNGGIYTDSDTQPRSHPYLWGTDAEPLVPQVLQPLLKLSNLTAPTLPGMPRVPKHIPNPNPDFLSYADAYEGGINDPEVSLVASVEFDAWIRDFPEDWKWGYVRSMQVVQWTIMAKPYHPILLDTLEIVVRNVERAEKEGTFDGSIGALDMTGPGPFTDAIYRYFIAMYGVPPKPFERRTRSSRVGDVILLPEWSFAQPGPQPDEWDWSGPEPQTRCVSHAFMGRWKDDGWGPYN